MSNEPKKRVDGLKFFFRRVLKNSLSDLVGAGHGEQRFPERCSDRYRFGSSCSERQRPLASVHLHPEVTAKPAAAN